MRCMTSRRRTTVCPTLRTVSRSGTTPTARMRSARRRGSTATPTDAAGAFRPAIRPKQAGFPRGYPNRVSRRNPAIPVSDWWAPWGSNSADGSSVRSGSIRNVEFPGIAASVRSRQKPTIRGSVVTVLSRPVRRAWLSCQSCASPRLKNLARMSDFGTRPLQRLAFCRHVAETMSSCVASTRRASAPRCCESSIRPRRRETSTQPRVTSGTRSTAAAMG